MTKTIRLNDLQLVLLSSAAARENGSLIPLPQNCTQDRARIGKAVAALLRRGLIQELPVIDRSIAWRDQDQDPVGLFITDAGRVAIGSGSEDRALNDDTERHASQDGAGLVASQTDAAPPIDTAITANERTQPIVVSQAARGATNAARAGSKIATVVALLERDEGATLDEMVEATGWLAHTTRAALTGLRKKGKTITKAKRGDVTCYRIAVEAGQ